MSMLVAATSGPDACMLDREQSREEEQKRDRQPRPTSPIVAGRGPNVADAGPTTSRGSEIPNQKEPSKPNDT